MDNQRLFLWLGLLLVVWLTWRTWEGDYGPGNTPPVTTTQTGGETVAPLGPNLELPELVSGTSPAPSQPTITAPGQTIRVVTDVLDLQIELNGGNLVQALLPRYPVHKNQPDVLIRLLSPDAQDYFVLQSGLRSTSGGAEPNHLAPFTAEQSEYRLAEGQDTLDVVLTWTDGTGLTVHKIYTFERGWYRFGLTQEVVNNSATTWTGTDYVQLRRLHDPIGRSMFNVESFGFTGPVLYDGDAYAKLGVGKLRETPREQTNTNGWLAGVQHHFLVAAVPDPAMLRRYNATAQNDLYQLSTIGADAVAVAPGSSQRFEQQLFIGPKLQEQLRVTGDRLQLTVNYGFLTLLSQPLFWVLDRVHSVVGNWGWAIIIVTMMIKLVFWKLTAVSGRSMAKMRKLAPRFRTLQERYKDDRPALSRAMLDMYKREKVNPALGCLPMLIQLPFFLAFYWMLLESVEMRQAPFMLWINDLSSRDPFFVLPLLMGAAMFIQSRLNPAPPDPIQARIMQILPLIFTVFFALFPAGLVLYWLTNTVLSVFQQWLINRQVEAADKARPTEATT